jgi:hypothetical protein
MNPFCACSVQLCPPIASSLQYIIYFLSSINQWRDQCIQYTYDQRINYQSCVNAAYYFNRILLIGRRPLNPSTRSPCWAWFPSHESRFDGDPLRDYVPTFDDIVNIRVRTTRIVESEVDLPEPYYNTLIDMCASTCHKCHDHDDIANHHKHFTRPTTTMSCSPVVPNATTATVIGTGVHNNNSKCNNNGSLITPSKMLASSCSPSTSSGLLTGPSERKANPCPTTIIRKDQYGSCWQLQSPVPLAFKTFDVGIPLCYITF